MGFYESQKEILARSDYYDVAFIGSVDSAIAGFGSSAIYLYTVLILFGKGDVDAFCWAKNHELCVVLSGQV